jgi:MraZ protein
MFQDSQETPPIELDFTGFFEHTLDTKGRVTVPAQYRDKSITAVYLTQSFDGNLDVYPVTTFNKIKEKVKLMNTADPTTRLLRRVYLTGATKADLDGSGRILIPPHQRDYAQITNEVVITGVGDHFEIWSPENWHKQYQKILDAMQNPQVFAHLNL